MDPNMHIVVDDDYDDDATFNYQSDTGLGFEAGAVSNTDIDPTKTVDSEVKDELDSSLSERSSLTSNASEDLFDFALDTRYDLDPEPARSDADTGIKSSPVDENYDLHSLEAAASPTFPSPEPNPDIQGLKRSASPDGDHGAADGPSGSQDISGTDHVSSSGRRKRSRIAHIPYEPFKVYPDTRFGGSSGVRMSEKQWEYIQEYASKEQRQRIRQHRLAARRNLYDEPRCSTMAFYQEDGAQYLDEEILPLIPFPQREVIDLEQD